MVWFGWVGLGWLAFWVGLGWAGVGWVGLVWIELAWIGQNRLELGWRALARVGGCVYGLDPLENFRALVVGWPLQVVGCG